MLFASDFDWHNGGGVADIFIPKRFSKIIFVFFNWKIQKLTLNWLNNQSTMFILSGLLLTFFLLCSPVHVFFGHAILILLIEYCIVTILWVTVYIFKHIDVTITSTGIFLIWTNSLDAAVLRDPFEFGLPIFVVFLNVLPISLKKIFCFNVVLNCRVFVCRRPQLSGPHGSLYSIRKRSQRSLQQANRICRSMQNYFHKFVYNR